MQIRCAVSKNRHFFQATEQAFPAWTHAFPALRSEKEVWWLQSMTTTKSHEIHVQQAISPEHTVESAGDRQTLIRDPHRMYPAEPTIPIQRDATEQKSKLEETPATPQQNVKLPKKFDSYMLN